MSGSLTIDNYLQINGRSEVLKIDGKVTNFYFCARVRPACRPNPSTHKNVTLPSILSTLLLAFQYTVDKIRLKFTLLHEIHG